ncbi:MAG TPA: response regulator, partial [Lysobacter sp.]|nr:response regulator [Lysobacter sp.]
LPAGTASASGIATASPHRHAGRSVLLVEDDALVAEVVRGLLEGRGHAVTRVPHALDALAAVRATEFDLAMLDLDLPGVDGFELARLLRSLGHGLPLLALTARADAAAEPLARAAGMDGFLRKPVDGVQLDDVIAALMAASTLRAREPLPA